MFKNLYCCARTAARHESGPAAQSRLAYLQHLAAGGATLHTLRANAGVIYRSAVYLNLDDSSPVARAAVEEAARAWAHRRYLNLMAKGPEQTEKEFRLVTCCWLRFAGRLQESSRPPTPHQAKLDAYYRYMTEERGLAESTVKTAGSQLPKFLKYTTGKTLKQMRLADVELFLAHLGERGWTRHGINAMAYVLRSFFKYAETQRWTKPGIGAEIHGPRLYRHESLPLGPSWPDVQRLLASTETDYPYDIRDRPILLLLAVYGMRIGEVRGIRLCDVDWDNRTLTIPLTKQRRARICPVIPMLAEALERYVQEVRPKCQSETLFLRLRAPHRQFNPGGLYAIVGDRMKRLKIESPRTGPHSLRHACATHLLAQGLTLTEVGGHLGHSSADSTRVYAKVDMPRLREVAELDLGGLL
ncbi:MAG: site-specific integrase [Acidobacteriota bacterium]|nr:site-specific integrase [Acidobacteriota bacterium]